jgi:hypothetical protein
VEEAEREEREREKRERERREKRWGAHTIRETERHRETETERQYKHRRKMPNPPSVSLVGVACSTCIAVGGLAGTERLHGSLHCCPR